MKPQKITIRARGKCHPALRYPDGFVSVACSCPGTHNGKLAHHSVIIAEGWDAANCGNRFHQVEER